MYQQIHKDIHGPYHDQKVPYYHACVQWLDSIQETIILLANLHLKHSLIVLILLLKLFVVVILVGALTGDSEEAGVFNLEVVVHAELVTPYLNTMG